MSESAQPAAAGNSRVSGSVVVGIFAIVLLAAGLSVAAYLQTIPRPVAIADILGNLREYDGRSVTVRGQVDQTANLFGVKGYTLRDDTGSITVLTQRGLPEEDSMQTVSGIVRELYKVGPASMTVLQEPLPPGE